MRKYFPLLLVLLLVAPSLVPAIKVEAEEPAPVVYRGGNYVDTDFGNGTHSWESAPQWVFNGSHYVPYIYSETEDYIQVQSGLVGARIYKSGYAEFWDPNMTEVRLYEERWEVSYYDGRWKVSDTYNPEFSVTMDEGTVNVTVGFITDWPNNGERAFTVKYIFREGSALKHEIDFTSYASEQYEFNVTQKWAGIVASKVKHDQGEDVITTATTVDSSHFRFLKENGNLSIVENQWDMYYGYNETVGVYYVLENKNLKPVEIDVHAQGLKADFVFGTWNLAQGESLRIDPGTATLEATYDEGVYLQSGTYKTNLGMDDLHFYRNNFELHIWRAFIEWDITSIPDVATVTEVTFKYHGRSHTADGGHIHEFGFRPSTSGTNQQKYNEAGEGTVYASGGGFPVVGANQQINLGAVARTDLEAQLSANWFAIGLQNDNEATESYSCKINSEDYGSSNPKPSLYVVYSTVTAPTVSTLSATSVEETTANPRGQVTATGGENPTRYIEYDIDSGAPYAYSDNAGVGGTGIYNSDLTGLTPGEKYYYRAKAGNSGGTAYGSEMTFITKPNAPSSLNAYSPTDTQISLSWTKGTGAYYTYVRRKVGSYPTSISDGVQVYADTGSGTTDSSLSPGVYYFYRAWSRAYDGEWGPYSDSYSSDAEYTKPSNPSGLSATAMGSTQIDLAWTKGTGADKTHIRRKIGSYPTSISDGDPAYFDTGVSKEDTGLIAGNDYYYRGWAYDTDSGYYSSGYTEDWDRTPQTHNEEVSQSLSITGEAIRTLSAVRSPTQGIMASVNSLRSWQTSRTLTQSLTPVIDGGRTWDTTRIATQSIVSVLTGNRIWDATRNLEQTIQFNFETSRLWTLMKKATQSLSASFNAERNWSTSRLIPQSLSMASGVGRTLGAMRVLTQAITATFNGERLMSLLRTVSQGFSLSLEGNRLLGLIRSATQEITSTFNAKRTLDAIRTASQTIAATFDIERVWGTSRTITQGISMLFNANRLLSLSRMVSQSVSPVFNAFKAGTFPRVVSQSLSFVSNTFTRLYGFMAETVSLTITTAFDALREWSLLRTMAQSLTATFNSGRAWTALRVLAQSISMSSNVERLWSTMRTVSQGVSTAFNGERFVVLLRSVAQGISISGSTDRLWNALRTVSQTITASTNVGRLWSTTRELAQTVSMSFIIERLWSTTRALTQGLSATFEGNRVVALLRSGAQGISASFNSERLLDARRMITQALTATFSTERLWSTLRTATQGISASFNTGRLWSTLRTVYQGISTTINGERLVNLLRSGIQAVSVSLNSERLLGAMRTLSQEIVTSVSAFKTGNYLKVLSQGLSTAFNTERYWVTSRVLIQELSAAFNAQRIWTLMRRVSQAMSLSMEGNRFLSLIRSAMQGITVSTNIERSWVAMKIASQMITATFNGLREWSLLRTMAQSLSVILNAERVLTALRTLTQDIVASFNSVRFWTAFRGVSQIISTSLSVERIGTFSRGVFQGLNLVLDSLIDLPAFMRQLSLSINVATQTLRSWSLSRVLTQGLNLVSEVRIFMGIAKGELVSLSLEVLIRLNVFYGMLNAFNTGLIMLNALTLLSTGMFIGRDRDVGWGAISTFLWFTTAMATIVDNPENWISVRVYGMAGVILIVLTLISIIQRLEPEEEYFEDWG